LSFLDKLFSVKKEAKMADTKFKVGDLVQLKSGGAVMVVEYIEISQAWEEQEYDDDGELTGQIIKHEESIGIHCRWHDKEDRPQHKVYDTEILVKA